MAGVKFVQADEEPDRQNRHWCRMAAGLLCRPIHGQVTGILRLFGDRQRVS